MHPVLSLSLKERLIQKAQELGFQLAGVTGLAEPPHAVAYETWLRGGMHAGMGYLAGEKERFLRCNPAQVLAGARCVLVLGTPYPARIEEPAGEGLLGRVAAYAWGTDYHLTLQEKAGALLAFLAAEVGGDFFGRAYTDTGPILERALAFQAGLGWQGKNTCLISPQYGSYFFLSEVFLNLELEMDEPFPAERCGSCTRCLDVCPTGCLLPGRVLDARRCLAYLTIENKGPIPVELRPALGERVFGCDACQQVCPWNRKALTAPAAAQPHPDLDLIEALSLSPQEFNRRYKHSPLQRAKRRGLLRNAAVVLGNLKSSAALPALARVLAEEAEGLVRGHAAWALGQIGGLAARTALEAALSRSRDFDDHECVAEIQRALEVCYVD